MALVPTSSNQLIAVPIKSLNTTSNKIQFSTTIAPHSTNTLVTTPTNLTTIKSITGIQTLPANLKIQNNFVSIKKNDNIATTSNSEMKSSATYLICPKNNLINDHTKLTKEDNHHLNKPLDLSKTISYQLNSHKQSTNQLILNQSIKLPINQIIDQTVNQSYNQTNKLNNLNFINQTNLTNKLNKESSNNQLNNNLKSNQIEKESNEMEVEYQNKSKLLSNKLDPILEEELNNDPKNLLNDKDESNQSNNSNRSNIDDEKMQDDKLDDYVDDIDMLSSPAESEFDPVDYLIWNNNVGTLPGTNLQFKLNEYDIIEIINDEEADELRKQNQNKSSTKYLNYQMSNASSNNTSLSNHDSTDSIYSVCLTCGSKKLRSLFIRKGRFCSQKCATLQSTQLRNFKKSLNTIDTKMNSFKKQLRNRSLTNNYTDIYYQNNGYYADGDEIEDFKTKVKENYKQDKYFSWKNYLIDTRSAAAPLKCFKSNQIFNDKQNLFKPNMKLEAIDPQHQSLFCVATVAEVCGYRLRIHLDGYSSQFDFWVNCDSPFIFHTGFCDKTNRKLQLPKNYLKQFNWSTYLSEEKAKAAPKNCFYWFNKQINQPAGFKVGMKCEAVDRANSSLICVATINDIISDWLLIHFDGWDDSYDYWTQINSPYLHPIGWCKSKGKSLTPPKDFRTSDKFNWTDYLERTNSISVAPSALRVRTPNLFKPNMKLEVVDKRNPRYIRVATIISRSSYSVKINFDNWDERYDFWIDDDSPDLHPIQWCYQTNNYIEEPPSYEYDSSSYYNKCPIFGCKGIGNFRNTNLIEHETVEDCPYSEENLDYEPPDRFGDSSDLSSSDNIYDLNELESNFNSNIPSPNSDSISTSDKLNKQSTKNYYSNNYQFNDSDFYNNSDSERLSRSSSPNSDHNLIPIKQNMIDIKTSFLQLEEPLLHWDKNTKHLVNYINSLNCEDVLEWTSDQVADFINTLPGCADYSLCFRNENVDGEAFLLLTQSDLIKILEIKLGPAIKIYNCILLIRKNICSSSQ